MIRIKFLYLTGLALAVFVPVTQAALANTPNRGDTAPASRVQKISSSLLLASGIDPEDLPLPTHPVDLETDSLMPDTRPVQDESSLKDNADYALPEQDALSTLLAKTSTPSGSAESRASAPKSGFGFLGLSALRSKWPFLNLQNVRFGIGMGVMSHLSGAKIGGVTIDETLFYTGGSESYDPVNYVDCLIAIRDNGAASINDDPTCKKYSVHVEDNNIVDLKFFFEIHYVQDFSGQNTVRHFFSKAVLCGPYALIVGLDIRCGPFFALQLDSANTIEYGLGWMLEFGQAHKGLGYGLGVGVIFDPNRTRLDRQIINSNNYIRAEYIEGYQNGDIDLFIRETGIDFVVLLTATF